MSFFFPTSDFVFYFAIPQLSLLAFLKWIVSGVLQESLMSFSCFCVDPLTDLWQVKKKKNYIYIMPISHPPSCHMSNKLLYFGSLQTTQESRMACSFEFQVTLCLQFRIFSLSCCTHIFLPNYPEGISSN